MAIINYVAESKAVMQYCCQNALPVRERMLLIALFHIANSRAVPVWDENASTTYDWPDDFFAVSTMELSLYSGLDKRAIADARNALSQRGVIEFNSGQRRTKVPEYRINYFAFGCNSVPKSTPKGDQKGTKSTPKGDQKGTKRGPYNKYNYNINQVTLDEVEEEGEDVLFTRTREEDELAARIGNAFLTKVGRKVRPAEMESIARTATMLGVDLDLVDAAIERAAMSGAGNIAGYTTAMLRSCAEQGVMDSATLSRVESINGRVRAGDYTAAEGYEQIRRIVQAAGGA